MPARRVLWLFIAAAILVGVGFIPLKSLSCLAWDVWAIYQGGHPVPGATVRVTFQNYSAERESHEVEEVTDAQGHAKFSAQFLSASVGNRMFMTLSSATAGVHVSFGPHASVFASGDGLQGVAIDERQNVLDWTGKPAHMESRVVLAPLKTTPPAR